MSKATEIDIIYGVRKIFTGYSRAVLQPNRKKRHKFQHGSGTRSSRLVSTSGMWMYVKTRGQQFESSARGRKKRGGGTMKIPVWWALPCSTMMSLSDILFESKPCRFAVDETPPL